MTNRTILRAMTLAVILSMMFSTFVVAQPVHSLEWETEVGEEFTYVIQRKIGDQAGLDYVSFFIPFANLVDEGQKMIAQFTEFETIPDEIPNSQSEPKAYCNLTRANDSVTILSELNGFAVPANDWAYLTSARNLTAQPGVTVINDAIHWGYIASGIYPGTSDVEAYNEVRYEKVNGTLVYNRWRFSQLGSTLVDVILVQWYEGMPTVIGPDIDIMTILIGAIAVCLFLICGFLSYRGYKNRPSMMRELGK